MPRNREANINKILESARKIVVQRGVYNTNLRDIAKEAGMSNGALYYYFNSKDLILYALMDQPNVVPLRFAKKVKGKQLTPDQIRERLFELFKARINDTLNTKLFIYLAQEAILGDEELKAKFAQQYEEWVSSIEDVIVEIFSVPKTSTSRGLAILLEAVTGGAILQNLLGLNQEGLFDILHEILSGEIEQIMKSLYGETNIVW